MIDDLELKVKELSPSKKSEVFNPYLSGELRNRGGHVTINAG